MQIVECGMRNAECGIKPLTKTNWERGKLIGFERAADVAPKARLGVKWVARLEFPDGSTGYFMVGYLRAKQLWPDLVISGE